MILESEAIWFAQTNAYLLAPEPGGVAVLVDAPPDPVPVAGWLKKHDLTLGALLVTHGHLDHVGGAWTVVSQTDATAYVHPDDDFLTLAPDEQLRQMLGMVVDGEFGPPPNLVPLADGQKLTVGGMTFSVLHTPGHTPGHCCFLLDAEGMLFSGDQLFAGSIGRTDFPYGSHDLLMASMQDKILPLADELIVLPGHGPRTTLGHERRTNPFLTS